MEEITPAAGTLPFTNGSAANMRAPVTQKQSRPEPVPPTISAPVSAPTPVVNPAQPASTPEKQKVPHIVSPLAAKAACQCIGVGV